MVKIRILYCIPNMGGGGAERQLVYLSGELVRRGWDVHVALLKEGPNFEGLKATDCIIHRIPAWGNHDITILWHLMRLIRNIRPQIIQTWMRQMDVFGGIASRLTHTPFILSERSDSSAYPASFKHSLRLSTGRNAAAIVSNSEGGSRYWQTQIGNGVPGYVVNNALPIIDIARAEKSMCGLQLSPTSRAILFAGRFSAEKNIDNIIRAFKIVLKQKDAVLLLCGEGELHSQIEYLIRKENLADRVFLPGYIKNIWGLMKRADLLISMSDFEGLPNVVLEAMACGCPLVISDIAAHRAFLDEDMAFFVDQGRVSDIASTILACLDNPERAKQMAQNAKAAALSFSIKPLADRHEEIYNQILMKLNTGKQ